MKLRLTLALEHEVRAALDQLAEKQERSRSWIANRMLREGVAARLTDGTGGAGRAGGEVIDAQPQPQQSACPAEWSAARAARQVQRQLGNTNE